MWWYHPHDIFNPYSFDQIFPGGACQACTVAIFMSRLYLWLFTFCLIFSKLKHSLTEVMWLTPLITDIPQKSGEDLKSNYTYVSLLFTFKYKDKNKWLWQSAKLLVQLSVQQGICCTVIYIASFSKPALGSNNGTFYVYTLYPIWMWTHSNSLKADFKSNHQSLLYFKFTQLESQK